MKYLFLRFFPEGVVVTVLAVVALTLSQIIQAPFRFPSPVALLFIGLTYLVPFIFISIWILLPLPFLIYRGELKGAVERVVRQAGYALCLATVMLLQFHIKLWAPLINPRNYDHLYEVIDRHFFFWLDPLIAWRGQLHNAWVDHFYFNLFMLMFICSFIVHYIRGKAEFRRVFLASILVQAFGGIGYLVAPALGPFIYRNGVNAHITSVQHLLLHVHQALLAGGTRWLQDHTSESIAGGLGAMPSLHVAVSFVFLYYAQKSRSWLAWIYWPIFLWIVFEAMASRWHYGIDLVVGFGLSCGCIALANAWLQAHEAIRVPKPSSEEKFGEVAATELVEID